jgi:heme/copper-type cytochrome/quinol oxidase subunit 3
VLVQSLRGRYHRYRRVAVDLCAAYWYLVVVVWIFFFGLLYFG